MKFFQNITNLDDLKKEYKRLCKIHHPDLGGNTKVMQDINAEYDQMLETQVFKNHFESENCKTSAEVEKAMREVIEKLIILKGISLEICGTWLWITGKTYPVKSQIKAAGCFFARKKVAWYWRPAEQKSSNRKPLSLDKIRERHGSINIINNKKVYSLA